MTKKNIYFIMLLFCVIFSSCKSAYIYECNNADKPFKIKYDYPTQKAGVSDMEYKGQIRMLEDIYNDYRYAQKFPSRSKEFTGAVPWNLAVTYGRLQEPSEKILCLLCKEEEERGKEQASRPFENYDRSVNKLNLTKQQIDSLTERYEPYFKKELDSQISSGHTIWNKDKLDQDLVRFMKLMVQEDQKYRSEDTDYYMKNLSLQTALDSINMMRVDSLYNHYGSYVGRSLVGESNEYVMWAVIQHASLEKQEFYLSIVHKAVQDFELKEGPFKMLIDRIYHKKYDYQIFGSQQGIELGSKTQIKKAKKRFGLED
ncbi:MAG: hypothetical protein AB8B73_04985 [Ekhidna sp.]